MDPYIQYLENKALKHLVVDSTGRIPIDHADTMNSASHYIGSWLVAKKPVNIFSSPMGNKIAQRGLGEIIGRIYSWAERDGEIWWQLEGPSGNGTGGFVKHTPGAFDTSIALDTASGKEHEENVQQLQDLTLDPLDKLGDGINKVATGIGDAVGGIGNTLSGLGNNLPLLIGAIIVFLLAMSYFKFKSV